MSRLLPTCAAAVLLAVAAAPAGAATVAEMEATLARERDSTEAERRAVLVEIGADVPDAKGRFQQTKRGSEEATAEEDLDWLAALTKLAPMPGLDDVIADVETIRALAATPDVDAGRAILDFAFTDLGLVYRDECGRYLRNMSPFSLPALIVASQATKSTDKARYARYQLERLDREHPLKALRYAGSDAMRIAILKAYLEVHHREAVPAVLNVVDDVSPAVRAQARETWMGYVLGPAPPEAPKKKLQLPGGKLTDEPQPLYLNYRQLAKLEIDRRWEEVTGEKPPRGLGLVDQSEQLFAIFDQRRAERRDAAFARGTELAGQQSFAEAAAEFDAVLVEDPSYENRASMAPGYFAYGDELKKQKKWRAAAIAYGKANAVDASGPNAQVALGAQFYAQGRVAQKAGEDPTRLFELALEHDPSHKGAAAALAGDDPDAADDPQSLDRPRWLLYAGVAGGTLALLLLLLALLRSGRTR
jgi:tetratricopeptide (TPR) repeat protein